MSETFEPPPAGLAARLWTYQRERFPVVTSIPLLVAFAGASVAASAHLADRPMPGLMAYATSVVLAIGLFWLVQVAREIRDRELNDLSAPHLPLQRGVVSLREIMTLSGAVLIGTLLAAYAFDAFLLFPLGAALIWIGHVAAGFFVPRLINASPVLFLLTHIVGVPLIGLLMTACEWGPSGRGMPDGLWTFLLMSLANACMIEVSDGITAPASKSLRKGLYSTAWGLNGAVAVITAAAVLAYGCLVAYGAYIGLALHLAEAGLLFGIPFACCLVSFAAYPTPTMERTIAAASRIWIVACYALAAGLPFIWSR